MTAMREMTKNKGDHQHVSDDCLQNAACQLSLCKPLLRHKLPDLSPMKKTSFSGGNGGLPADMSLQP
jgi:hypothetical protein